MEKIRLMDGWQFCRGSVKRWTRVDHDLCYNTTKAGQEAGDMEVFLKENPWQAVGLPHDWSTWEASDPAAHPNNGFKPRGEGWYYKTFTMPDYPEDAIVSLEFEGVMGECVVYVNGVLATRNFSGYTAFAFDISDFVLPKEEVTVVVSVDNTRWEGWWYEGAGIYRPVTLTIQNPVHIARMGTFARPRLIDGVWNLSVETAAVNETDQNAEIRVESTLFAPDGKEMFTLTAGACVPAFGKEALSAERTVESPTLWSPDSPVLYRLKNVLFANGEAVEEEELKIGFRNIEWTDHGMYINGKLTPVRGICCHQDHVGVGIAVPHSLIRYRIARLKEMGCNAYRCAHHCPSRELLEVCDEMGMLVMAENRHYRSTDEVMLQLDELTLLSRNHPSVFLYSLFNEEPWQAEIRGRRMASRMLQRIHSLDPDTPVTAAMNGGVLTKENASDVLDVAGMNYDIKEYMAYAARRPGHPMVGTENGPLFATRGIYQDDKEAQVFNAYGLTTSWFGELLTDTMDALEEADHVAGIFVWGGFEYRGEPQPFEWPSVFSHWGLMDNCGFEKDTFYMLRSFYSDADEPMVHVLPHWNHADGETVRVCVMTNCEKAQIFVNGKAYEEKKVDHNRAEWEIPFEAGTLRAEAKYGDTVLVDEVKTTGPAAKLEVVDAADAIDYDTTILNVRLLDENGLPVPGRENDCEIRFMVEVGTLIGAGNGDPNGIQPDVTDHLPTFCGRCQALIRPENGAVRVRVEADGLPAVTYTR